jgi:hypothetical protein
MGDSWQTLVVWRGQLKGVDGSRALGADPHRAATKWSSEQSMLDSPAMVSTQWVGPEDRAELEKRPDAVELEELLPPRKSTQAVPAGQDRLGRREARGRLRTVVMGRLRPG